MKIPVERYLEQVLDGSFYKGYIKIFETEFNYELKFKVPIPKLNGMDLTSMNKPEQVRRIFQLVLKRNEFEIELSDKEYGFFFEMLVIFAAEFYNNPKTRLINDGFLGKEGKLFFEMYGGSMSLGIENKCLFDFPFATCKMLDELKAKCSLF